MSWRVSLAVAALLIGVVFCLAVHTTAAPAPVAPTDGTGQAELSALTQAYADLASGNHDYKGHRIKALKAVEAACHLLGLSLSGDGKSHQQQRSSDERLREAQNLLQNVRDTAQQAGQKGVLNHVNIALNEISIALTIK